MSRAASLRSLNGSRIARPDPAVGSPSQKENRKPSKPVHRGRLILIAPRKLLIDDSAKRIDDTLMLDRLRSKFGMSSVKLVSDYVPPPGHKYSDRELERELRKYRNIDKRAK